MAVVEERDLEATRESLSAWLIKRLSHATDVEISKLVVPSSNGFSNETYLFEASWVERGTVEKHDLVARTQAPGPSLHLNYDVLKQAYVMEKLEQHSSVPVPRVLWKETDLSVLGTPFFVMERVDGRVPPDDPPYTAEGWVLDLEPARRRTLCENGLRVFAAVHALDWRGIGLEFLERTDPGADPLARELAYCERFYAHAAEGHSYPIIEQAFAWMRANRPTKAEPAVLNWGDGRLGNMIFGDDLSVTAALDWELASIASPEQDLGHWLCQDRIFTEGMGHPLAEGFLTRDEIIARYEEYSGHEVQYADFYEALAAFRSSLFRVRNANMRIHAGLLSPDSTRANNNAATRILADMIGLPAPTDETPKP
jgi:aminoglycoside phosphotransferase (APT) family kinase protein